MQCHTFAPGHGSLSSPVQQRRTHCNAEETAFPFCLGHCHSMFDGQVDVARLCRGAPIVKTHHTKTRRLNRLWPGSCVTVHKRHSDETKQVSALSDSVNYLLHVCYTAFCCQGKFPFHFFRPLHREVDRQRKVRGTDICVCNHCCCSSQRYRDLGKCSCTSRGTWARTQDEEFHLHRRCDEGRNYSPYPIHPH